MMKIIVGLGNPGKGYENTRHNTGFMVVEEIVKSSKVSAKGRSSSGRKSQNHNLKLKANKKFKAEICQIGTIGQIDKLLLVKPLTFMNSSGKAVKKILQFNNLAIKQFNNLYVIHDDLDIPLGEYKIQFGRSSAGHKGVESIIQELGTKDFWRVRIGIQPQSSTINHQSFDSKEYVLQEFDKEEKKCFII